MSGFRVTPYISDHAVLQRNEFIPVRGTADAGARVVAIFSKEDGGADFIEETLTDEDGNWKLLFMPMQAGHILFPLYALVREKNFLISILEMSGLCPVSRICSCLCRG